MRQSTLLLLTQLLVASINGSVGSIAQTCSNGLSGVESTDGDTCCPVECGQCGGAGCRDFNADLGGEGCCTREIAMNGIYCDDPRAEAPCIIRPTTPEDVFCSDGTPGIDSAAGTACCPAGCGKCGGTGCRSFSPYFGAADCCTGVILESDILCDTPGAAAPCIITSTEPEACDPEDDTCPGDTICCPDKRICEEPEDVADPGACGDPHMTGFLGQKFDFTGEDGGHYALISDLPSMHMNMRVTSPVPELPVITYITGLSILTTDSDGVTHSIVVETKDPHNIESSCPPGVSPCLADGSLRVILDGVETLSAPGSVTLGEDVIVSAVNIPGQCRSFGFEQYWERKKLENARHGRRLGEPQGMGEWVLGDPTATNMDECIQYVVHAETQDGGLFSHQSEHASFQIVTPKANVRLSHGRLHQIATRDPTDQFDLPDHVTWQMNMGIDHHDVSRAATGILGETFVPTLDADGHHIMSGMESIRGSEEDYRVSGPLGVYFAQDSF